MRVCDRHPRTIATDCFIKQSTDERYDLCKECSELIAKFMSEPKQKEVEKEGFWKKRISA